MRLDVAAGTSADWIEACPDDGDWCLLEGKLLRRLRGGALIELSEALRASLPSAGAAGIASDEHGTEFRLRAAAAGEAWLLISIDECRKTLVRRWRSVLGAYVADSILHELRNPLNALVLQRDLLVRGLDLHSNDDSSAAIPKALARLAVMRERMQELLARQNAAVALWLADDAADERAPSLLPRALEDTVRLVRSRYSQSDLRLAGDPLSVPADGLLHGGFALPLALVAVLVLAGDAVVGRPDAEVRLRCTTDREGLHLGVAGPLAYDGMAASIGVPTAAALRAALSLLLRKGGAVLAPPATDGGVDFLIASA